MVGQVLGQVVAILHRRGRPDRVVVVVQGGHELVGLAAVEAVPAVEAPGQRPGGARRGHVRLVLGGQVPLADGVGRVAGRAQDLGQVAVLPRRLAPVAGIADRQVGHPAHAAAMVVAAGQQAGPGRRAQRRRVEVREPDAAGGQAVDAPVSRCRSRSSRAARSRRRRARRGRTLGAPGGGAGSGGHQGSESRQSRPIRPPKSCATSCGPSRPRWLVPPQLTRPATGRRVTAPYKVFIAFSHQRWLI